ncbi:MAG: hypothetical protein FGM26_13355, partial [Beijerinckiaceae bacterium]|nr:hypothetical protein [Beijerinckiaceae bacterium]
TVDWSTLDYTPVTGDFDTQTFDLEVDGTAFTVTFAAPVDATAAAAQIAAVLGGAGTCTINGSNQPVITSNSTGATSSVEIMGTGSINLTTIGLAAGTVLLPMMSKHIAAGSIVEAHHQQNRAVLFTLALSVPFFIGFLTIPVEIMKALFARGAFTDAAAREAGAVLAAYGTGLLAIVLIRPAVASFYARNDTTTPLIASFSGIGVNVILKIALFRTEGAPGLAFATATGAWVNLALLVLLAHRRAWMDFDGNLGRGVAAMIVAAIPLAFLFWFGTAYAQRFTAPLPPLWQAPAALALLGVTGAFLYFCILFVGLKSLRVRLR